MIDPSVVFFNPPFVERAVTDAPLTAFVPSSIFTVPDEYVLELSVPRSISPLPVTTILRTGRTRAFTVSQLIIPVAVHGRVSSQTIFVVSAPLPTTLPVPIFVAAKVEAVETTIPVRTTEERRR